MASEYTISSAAWRLDENGDRVQVWYRGKIGAGEWVATDNQPVCQDHAWPEACPFHK
jgi:hypothetical protein